MRWPGGASPGGHCPRIVEALDVVPTLLEAAAIQRPAALQGCSLLADLRGEEGAGPGCAITEMTPTKPQANWKTLRVEGLRYVVDASGAEALFDLERDPLAYEDVAGRKRIRRPVAGGAQAAARAAARARAAAAATVDVLDPKVFRPRRSDQPLQKRGNGSRR